MEIKRGISQEMRESFLDYAMSVLVARALPDARDGLKPVHRRILYSMHELGLTHQAKFRKSALVVGDVLGKYHPHGDIPVYDALVRMAQSFSLRYPLIHGQGNWGSVDGDHAAAMRYCVTGDTLIPTERGLLPMIKISETKNESISTHILSMKGQINTASKWFDSGEHPTLSLKTNRGYLLRGSYNHPILTWSEDMLTGEPHFEWKLLSLIQEGDIVVLDRTPDALWPLTHLDLKPYAPVFHTKRVDTKQLPSHLTEDLAFILGLLVSEGTINEHEIEFCNSDPELIEAFKAGWQRTFPDCRLHLFNRKPSSYGKKPYYTIEIHSRYVIKFLRSIGLEPLYSKDKIIPFSILQSPKTVVAAFLRAYFEGDGSISFSGNKMTELSAISKSKKLLNQIQTILLRFGIASTRRYDTYKEIDKLYIRGLREYSLFEKEIGFFSSRKKSRLRNATERLHKEYSTSDYIPFISAYVRSMLATSFGGGRTFAMKHNFDRYSNLEQRSDTIVSAVVSTQQTTVKQLFDNLSHHQYLFDVVTEVKKTGIARVYSLRVDSNCHSFVGNGFINHNTECKMERITNELLRDIEKDTVDFTDNYDASRKEPVVLPATVPQLLLNGSLGIAVGMATNIPPHNLGEVMAALRHLLFHPDATPHDLMKWIKGPDFPTGGMVFNTHDIKQVYTTGRGSLVMRGEADVTEDSIVISSLPYQVNKAELIVRMADLVHDKKIEGVRDIRDESDKEGLRIAIDVKQGAIAQQILNALWRHTDLEKSFHVNMIALKDGIQPQTFTLKTLLEDFLAHRFTVVERRTRFDLARAEERIHILEGLVKALDHIEKIIETIKKSEDRPAAHAALMKRFALSDRQANAILEMRLATLAGLERKKVADELNEKRDLAKHLREILEDRTKMRALIDEEFALIEKTYGDERRTRVIASAVHTIAPEDLVPQKEEVVILTEANYLKRVGPEEFRLQRRGGRGLTGKGLREEDRVWIFARANTHDDILFFTDKGKVYQTKMYEIPEGTRAAKGKAAANVLALEAGENITSIIALTKSQKAGENNALVMATKNGIIKKTALSLFKDVRKSGIIAITLDKGDLLRWVRLVNAGDEIMLVTRNGQSIRFRESQARGMGRSAHGVRAIRLKQKDEIVDCEIIAKIARLDARQAKGQLIFTASEKGFGKKTNLKEYRLQARGGTGIKAMNCTAKTGKLVAAKVISDSEPPAGGEFIAISERGQTIRSSLKEIPVLGRATQGVRIMKLPEGDKLVSLVVL